MLSCFTSKAQGVAWALRRTFATAEAVANIEGMAGFLNPLRPHLWMTGVGYRHPQDPQVWVGGVDRGAFPSVPWA